MADYGNNRIQFFRSGEKNGTIVVGNVTLLDIILNRPRGVVLDFDDDLFTVDSGLNRIIRVGPTNCQCIADCDSINGSPSVNTERQHSSYSRFVFV